jgi:hypothetical protein
MTNLTDPNLGPLRFCLLRCRIDTPNQRCSVPNLYPIGWPNGDRLPLQRIFSSRYELAAFDVPPEVEIETR